VVKVEFLIDSKIIGTGLEDSLVAGILIEPLQKMYPGFSDWLLPCLSQIKEGKRVLIGALDDRDLVGVCILKYLKNEGLEINTLFVKLEFRDQKIGIRLYDQVLRHARDRGQHFIDVEVPVADLILTGFFVRRGFTEVSRNWRFGPEYALLRLALT